MAFYEGEVLGEIQELARRTEEADAAVWERLGDKLLRFFVEDAARLLSSSYVGVYYALYVGHIFSRGERRETRTRARGEASR